MPQDTKKRPRLRYPISFTPWKTCNAECGHCITNSGPRVKDHLSVDVVKRCLGEASELGIKGFQFTGGEPTLFLNKLIDMLSAGNALGMKAGMTTNGYFAKSYDRAYEVLKQLADVGLTAVRVSTDKYHDPFIPFERVLLTIEAAVACKLDTSVEVIVVRKDAHLAEVFKELRRYPVQILTGSLVRQGRGKFLEPDLFLTCSFYQLKQVRCIQAATVFVDVDGGTYYCCNYPRPIPGEALDTSLYLIGNVYQDSLVTIIENLEKNPLSKILTEEGPNGILELLKSKFGEEKISSLHNTQQRYHGLCDFCHSIWSNNDLIPLIREAVQYENGAGFKETTLVQISRNPRPPELSTAYKST